MWRRYRGHSETRVPGPFRDTGTETAQWLASDDGVYFGFRASRKPATARYPYGYGRAEDLAGIAIVAAIWEGTCSPVGSPTSSCVRPGCDAPEPGDACGR
jgi:hypothetical protein